MDTSQIVKRLPIVIIYGASGSGKSTLQNELIIDYDYEKVISTTTRPKRKNEKHGREYNFVTVEEFEKMLKNNEFVESIQFMESYYGLNKNSFSETSPMIVVLEPTGVASLLKYIEKRNDLIPIMIHMNISEKDRFKNMVKRGDDPLAIQRRIADEQITQDIVKLNLKADIKIKKLTSNLGFETASALKLIWDKLNC